MSGIPKILMLLAGVSFVMAVVTVYTGALMNIPPEGFSRACNNLALLAIAMSMIHKSDG